MKNKLQVIHTLTETLKFAFTKLPMAVRLGWLGLLISMAILAVGFVIGLNSVGGFDFFEQLETMGEGDEALIISKILGFYLSMIGWFILAGLAFVPFTVVIKQIAAGSIEPPEGIGYFRFGGREIKFILACMIISILSAIVFSILMVPTVLTVGVALFGGIPADAWEALATDPDLFGQAFEQNVESGAFFDSLGIGILAFLVGLVLYIWFAIRACLFTTAAAVESSIAPFGSFGLTGGNVWRLVGLFILYIIVIMAIEVVLQIAISIVAGIGIVSLIPMLENGGGAGSIGIAVVACVIFALIMLIYLFFRIILDMALPAKIYANLTREEGDLHHDHSHVVETDKMIDQLDNEVK